MFLCLLAGCTDAEDGQRGNRAGELLNGRRQASDGIDRIQRFHGLRDRDRFYRCLHRRCRSGPAAKLPYLRTIVLRGTKVTDAGLAVFKDCQYLETVDLSHSLISGSGLRDLRFGPIKDLNLSNSKFDDRGIADLVEIGHHLLRLISPLRTSRTRAWNG